MEQETRNSYEVLDFRVNLSLEECLERLETYRAHTKFTEMKKIIVTIYPVKKNAIYKIELYQFFHRLELELEADGDTCLFTGQVGYNWLIPPIIAGSVFAFYWASSPVPLTLDNALFVLSILFGGSFLVYWLIEMGIAEEFKLKLREILIAKP